MRVLKAIGMALAIMCLAAPANSQIFRDRLSAFTGLERSWSVGVFNPFNYQFTKDWGLEAHPLVAMTVAPHLTTTQRWLSGQAWSLQGRYGLSAPTWSLKFAPPFGLRGYLSPQCLVSNAEPERGDTCDDPGWVLAPSLATRFSVGKTWVLTADLGFTVGVLVSGERPRPLDTYAPINLLYTPATHEYRADFGLRISRSLVSWLSCAAEFDIYRTGEFGPLSPWTFTTYLGFDARVSTHVTMTAGAIYFNHDQGAMTLMDIGQGYVRKSMIRSHDIYPTFDVIWTY
ncbi:MAG: hypothetical protein VX589_16700 [Myxococcota bacterium]|nr:hypothetical protein [Myxococcota bacterium]